MTVREETAALQEAEGVRNIPEFQTRGKAGNQEYMVQQGICRKSGDEGDVIRQADTACSNQQLGENSFLPVGGTVYIVSDER